MSKEQRPYYSYVGRSGPSEILANEREAFRLLDLIDMEFRSDPMSVQCFDLRIVEAVRQCVAKRRKHVKDEPSLDGPAWP